MGRAQTKAWKRLPLEERKAIEAHEIFLRSMYCMATGKHPVSLHHCHGGSLKDHGIHVGTGQKNNHWLQIPIHLEIHVGPQGIDGNIGVAAWEERWGTQFDMLCEVSRRAGFNVFKRAGYDDIEIEGLP